MSLTFSFVHDYFFVYLWLIITTLINMIAPVSGSAVVSPVTAYFTDPWRAIGIAGFTFFLTGLHRVYLFRHELLSNKKNIEAVRGLLPYSIIGSILGGTFISYLNMKMLTIVIISVSLYFIWKTIRGLIDKKSKQDKQTVSGRMFVGLMSGFLQGSGMPGSDMRNNYLRTSLAEVSVRAVGSTVGIVNLFLAGSIIFFNNKLTTRDIIFVISVTPFLLIAQIYGKKVLTKLPDRSAKILAISLSALGIILLAYKYLL